MSTIIFIASDGARFETEARDGDSVMQVAVHNGVDGIVAECGGSMMCATCHCYIDEDWAERVGARADGEEEMLESAACAILPTSRLSCQVRMSAALDGLIVHLPAQQA